MRARFLQSGGPEDSGGSTMKLKQGLLVAAATGALAFGAAGAFAQAEKKIDSQGGAQMQEKTQPQQPRGQAQDRNTQKSPSQAQDDMKKSPGQAQQRDSQAPRGQAQDRDMQKSPGQAQDQDMKRSPGQAQERDSKPGGTTGQTETRTQDSKSVQINEQQRTRISQTIKQKNVNLRHVERTQVNFQINIGAVVPRTIELHPVPTEIVTIVPAYRGFLYIVVDDELLIIHPRTYEIVAVIPA
ncbi:MAG: DUF1236 domain-containing protein [Bradyrhizobiaceae bacterium]|nr:DUF1236 domain-containing protein [Bradyrhizobiaceae bacterium]